MKCISNVHLEAADTTRNKNVNSPILPTCTKRSSHSYPKFQ